MVDKLISSKIVGKSKVMGSDYLYRVVLGSGWNGSLVVDGGTGEKSPSIQTLESPDPNGPLGKDLDGNYSCGLRSVYLAYGKDPWEIATTCPSRPLIPGKFRDALLKFDMSVVYSVPNLGVFFNTPTDQRLEIELKPTKSNMDAWLVGHVTVNDVTVRDLTTRKKLQLLSKIKSSNWSLIQPGEN